jgi:hypothetical protein
MSPGIFHTFNYYYYRSNVFSMYRLEAEMLMRARAAVQYEQREGARREREWAARELVDMPHPMLPFDVNGLN